jgi:tRNA(Met) C34 N-acetyltransferase TmcA
VDDYSSFTWVFFLQEKSQSQETLKRFLRRAQNEFRLRIKKFRSDNGTKFKNSQIEGFLEEEGEEEEEYPSLMSTKWFHIFSLHTSTKWCSGEEE